MRIAPRVATFVAMTGRLKQLARDARVRQAADVVLAAVLAVAALIDVARNPVAWGGSGPAQILLALAATLPLAVRARRPIVTVTVVNLAGGALLVLAAPHQPAFEPFAALVIGFYSLAAHTPLRRGIAAFAAMVAIGVPFSVVASARGSSSGNLLPPIAFLLAAWAVGRIIRSRHLRTLELEELTRQLEEQRDMQAEAAVAVERGRIARELHDVVAHNVSMMVVQAGAAERVLDGEQTEVRAALSAISETGRQTVDEMRTLLGVLRAGEDGETLSPQPGLGDLESLVGSVRDAGLPVALRIEGTPSTLSPALDLSAYRIVQEALTNTVKHAGPARAEVTIRYRQATLELEVRDDGAGAEDARSNGHGLIGMRERVALFGGRLDVGPSAAGFTVRASFPLAAAAR